MKQHNLDDYYDFYQEIPQADYLSDIEIQDEYENSSEESRPHGLSDEQVSKIAQDSLDAARRHHPSFRETQSNQDSRNS